MLLDPAWCHNDAGQRRVRYYNPKNLVIPYQVNAQVVQRVEPAVTATDLPLNFSNEQYIMDVLKPYKYLVSLQEYRERER